MIPITYAVIYKEYNSAEILMDFVGFIVIVEIDNWFGLFFEIILDAFLAKETT